MDSSPIIDRLTEEQKNIQSVIKLVREIIQLDKNRRVNVPKLKDRTGKLAKAVERFAQNAPWKGELMNWLTQYQSVIADEVAAVQKQFGVELEQALQKIGLSLSGHYPELKAGIFTIELNFEQMSTSIWFGPKQENLGRCPLVAEGIARYLEKVKSEIGSGLPEDQLLEKLSRACRRVEGENHDAPVPIIHVLAEMAHMIQHPRFLQDPKREYYKSYSRADFSYDLFRLRKWQMVHQPPIRVALVTATRAYTRKRTDFLWVPDEESGKGTVYSHLRIEGGMK